MIRWRRCQDVCIHYPGRSEGPSPGRTTLWSKHDVQFHFLQQMPRHTGYPADRVIRLRGGVVVQNAGCRGRLRDYPRRKGRINFWPYTLYRSGGVVINPVLYWARGHRDPWYLATSLAAPHQVAQMYRKRMKPERYFKDGKQHFGLNRSTVATTGRLQRLLAGVRASPAFRRQVCSRGKLGILHLGYEYHLATPDPPDNLFAIQRHQTGYA